MKVRKFTDEGHDKWSELYSDIFMSIDSIVTNRRSAKKEIVKGYNQSLKKRVEMLKNDHDLSAILEGAKEFEMKKFINSFDLALTVDKSLASLDYHEIMNDTKIWDWFSLQLFDQIFVPGEIQGYAKYRYVLDLDFFYGMRHLIRGPWWAVNQYGENAKIFTYTKPYIQNDWLEQFIKISSLREMKVMPEVCMKMYYDHDKDEAIPGTGKGIKPGIFPRLRDKISQFNKIKFIWGMKADQIIKILPREFNKYKSSGP